MPSFGLNTFKDLRRSTLGILIFAPWYLASCYLVPGAKRLFVLAELFVIPPHWFSEANRHRVAINRREGILGIASREFLGDAVADLDERLDDLELYDRPVGLLLIGPPVTPQHARPFARGGERIPHLRSLDQILDVAQALRPAVEILAGQRPNATAFPATQVVRDAIATDVEDVIQFKSTAVRAAAATTLISATLIAGVARVGQPAAIPLTRLLITAAPALSLLSRLLALSGLLPLALLAIGLRSLLFRSGLLATGLLTLAPARLLTGLLSLFARALTLRIVAGELLGPIAAFTGALPLPFAFTFASARPPRLRLLIAFAALTGLPIFGTFTVR